MKIALVTRMCSRSSRCRVQTSGILSREGSGSEDRDGATASGQDYGKVGALSGEQVGSVILHFAICVNVIVMR